ncbi:phytanoyl-CoA dioxygenase family protein [Dongia sedimenti]|uniref:Phytanoyl-CoA dioxygenase family protein n=1 Tax=Dongia sedimenti TaxID=3064282 RepID=A0ABU0YSC2_9PROT|nr:phytanoyl-CoA dioxygenase family protein [Rhodospirillaceae bacterium R-7]
MPALTEAQKEFFWTHGYLMAPDAVTPAELAALRHDFNDWVEESRGKTQNYGVMIDGRPRFDLEPGHSASQPALRRINSPVEVSQAFHDVMADSRMTDYVADLIGPNVKFHHSKVNSKLPGAATKVKWHQDFPFTPHSNDDLVTALLLLDDMTEENGALEVLAGSHRGDLHSLWHNGVFTGSIEERVADDMQRRAALCLGSAGSVCLMHTRLAHGSKPNLSKLSRTLFICVYSAEDAVPLVPNPVPSALEGLVVRGARTGRVRSKDFALQLPQKPAQASFFAQQAATYDG